MIGSWMQGTAQSWLVLVLTHSATDLGITVALQTLPTLLLGPYAGLVADRVDKRKLLFWLQILMGIQAAVLAFSTFTGSTTYTEILVMSLVLGLNNCFENPARQAFVLEMVGREQVRNAISLNSTFINVARAIGPAFAGIIIASAGESWCFALNAVSFIPVATSLFRMDVAELQPVGEVKKAKGQLLEGFRYVRGVPELLVPLIMMGIIGTFTYEFQVTLPVLAKDTFRHGSETFGVMTAVMGIGAVIGGLLVAAKGKSGTRALQISVSAFGLAVLASALAGNLGVEYVALFFVGFGSVSFLAMGNSTLQLAASPEMRGRVMAFWAIAFMGTTPIGGPFIGWLAAHFGARNAALAGALACYLALGISLVAERHYVKVRSELSYGDDLEHGGETGIALPVGIGD
jgi:MFS family permease